MKTLLRITCLSVLLAAVFSIVTANAQSIALMGGQLYAAPDAAPLQDAVVLTSDGRITAVGGRSNVQVPQDASIIDCTGKTVVAGFWNSHVHFTQAAWTNAAGAPAAALEAAMQDMLTQWGFTTVWDLGSDPKDTFPLRRRIEAGEVAGPRIYLAGSIFPQGGHPIYLPPEMQLPEAATPEQAADLARRYMQIKLDGLKLFTGSFMGNRPVVNMDPASAKAAVEVVHADGKPAFAHPQNQIGVDTVIAAGVDVLAHTVPGGPNYTSEQLARFKAQGIALIPTLSLMTTLVLDPALTARLVGNTVEQLRTFSDNGGAVLFGTDVGFTNLYDTSLEYELMRRALTPSQVLASLTTNPAAFFKAPNTGKVEKGFDADVVVLDGDPIADVRNLAKVAITIRAGKVIYRKP
jgi:imidazolonepropionase-like amidohydrolase